MNLIGLTAVLVIVCTTTAHGLTIPTALVGNAGNAPDTRYNGTSVGSVAYAYTIGKYEISAGQYTEFLNAVADTDTYGLYNPEMATNLFRSQIERTGSPGSYQYNVPVDWAERPVAFVSFWDAARFANWLHNGQPTGPQGPGNTEDGAYINVGNSATFARQPGAKFFIPTEDEWYKAAYHDKSAGLAASYFDYPTGTNVLPGRSTSESTTPGNNANYFNNTSLIGSPYYRTPVGELELSDSPYGTFDQAGNVFEWIDKLTGGGSGRRIRGGSFSHLADELKASIYSDYNPIEEAFHTGFRIAAAVPEPSSLALAILALLVLTSHGRRQAAR